MYDEQVCMLTENVAFKFLKESLCEIVIACSISWYKTNSLVSLPASVPPPPPPSSPSCYMYIAFCCVQHGKVFLLYGKVTEAGYWEGELLGTRLIIWCILRFCTCGAWHPRREQGSSQHWSRCRTPELPPGSDWVIPRRVQGGTWDLQCPRQSGSR